MCSGTFFRFYKGWLMCHGHIHLRSERRHTPQGQITMHLFWIGAQSQRALMRTPKTHKLCKVYRAFDIAKPDTLLILWFLTLFPVFSTLLSITSDVLFAPCMTLACFLTLPSSNVFVLVACLFYKYTLPAITSVIYCTSWHDSWKKNSSSIRCSMASQRPR